MSAFGGKADISGPLADDIAVRKPLNMPFLELWCLSVPYVRYAHYMSCNGAQDSGAHVRT